MDLFQETGMFGAEPVPMNYKFHLYHEKSKPLDSQHYKSIVV